MSILDDIREFLVPSPPRQMILDLAKDLKENLNYIWEEYPTHIFIKHAERDFELHGHRRGPGYVWSFIISSPNRLELSRTEDVLLTKVINEVNSIQKKIEEKEIEDMIDTMRKETLKNKKTNDYE